MAATIINQRSSPQTIIRVPQRKIEALVGGVLMNTIGKAAQKHILNKSKLVAKEIYLPTCDYAMYYHEREATNEPNQDAHDQPTIIFFHGLSMRSEELAGFTKVWIFHPTYASFVRSKWAMDVISTTDCVPIQTIIPCLHINECWSQHRNFSTWSNAVATQMHLVYPLEEQFATTCNTIDQTYSNVLYWSHQPYSAVSTRISSMG